MAFRAWRIVVWAQQNSSYLGIAELQFRATAGGTAQTGGTAFASDTYQNNTASWGPAFAFNGVTTDFFASDNAVYPHTLGMDYGGSPVNVLEIAITARSDFAGGRDQAPKTFELQGSANPSDPLSWEMVYRVDSATGWTNGETRVYTLPAAWDTQESVAALSVEEIDGAPDTREAIAAIALEELAGLPDSREAVASISIEELDGLPDTREAIGGLSIEAIIGPPVTQVWVAALAVEVIIGQQYGMVNGPVQIIAG